MNGNVIITRVIDGDTICFNFLGEEKSIRLYGIDCPETRFNKNDLSINHKHKSAGLKVKDYLNSFIVGKKAELKQPVHKNGKKKNDKYGRLLADVYVSNISISKHLLELGYAKEYHGQGDKTWKDEELDKILDENIFRENVIRASKLFIEVKETLYPKENLYPVNDLQPLSVSSMGLEQKLIERKCECYTCKKLNGNFCLLCLFNCCKIC